MTVRNFLIYGLVAGFVAGILAFAVAHTLGEPPVDASIAIEEAGSEPAPADHGDGATADHDHADEEEGHSHGEEAEVSRSTQSTWGLLTGTVVLGAILGGSVGIAAAFALGRLGSLLPAATTAVSGVVGFVSFSLVPFLTYPPNPPAVGSPDTIGPRTAEYFSMVLISVVAAVVAVAVGRHLVRSLGAYLGVVLPGLGYLVVVVVAALVLSPIDEVPDSFPADTLYDFRIASLLTQATLWAAITVVLCGLVTRAFAREQGRSARRAMAGAAG